MTTKVTNPYPSLVHVRLVNSEGKEDGVHLQPGATVKLPANMTIHPNTTAVYPRLRVADDAAVGGPVPSVVAEPVAPKISNKG